jgi:hypothetical protein
MHLRAAILALPLLAAAPDRGWYRICRSTHPGVTLYMDLHSIEGVGARTVADQMAVFDQRHSGIRAIRMHVEFDCSARSFRALTETYLDSGGEELRTVPADDFGFQPAEKDRISGRMLAFACDPEASDAPLIEDPLRDESADQAPAVS